MQIRTRVTPSWFGVAALVAGSMAFGCQAQTGQLPTVDAATFSAYWHQGKAEISSYQLDQSRYGRNHDGKAVLIFVTEDFSKTKQVKLDDPQRNSRDAVNVLKLNYSREFVTGIYEYNIMSSVFTPVDLKTHAHSLKAVTSVQDWCGQTFMQANWKGHRYDGVQYSYFESEGDKPFSVKAAWLEDEVWNRIRISPAELPIGEVSMIPSFAWLRLAHQEAKAFPANTSLVENAEAYTYEITYPELKRQLSVTFARDFPHQILNWTETAGDQEITTGTLIHSMMSDYWQKNNPEDEPLRMPLKLDEPVLQN